MVNKDFFLKVSFCANEINMVGKKIVILHTVIKKSSKIPQKDLDLAIKRSKALK